MNIKVSIERLCDEVGMTRQNFNKGHKKRVRQKVDEDLIRDLVVWERAWQPRLGGKKLYVLLKSEFKAAGIKIGRDRFFDVMRRQGLLLDPLPKAPRTTNSRHSLPVFSNLLTDMMIDGPDMAWLSDITYIRTDEGFLYLSLITDDWSRKIVGYNAGDSLETEGCLNALEQALKGLGNGAKPVHHSDRGCQYCSHMYTDKLREHGLEISMTQELHCYENAKAERVNGILKQEYALGGCFRTKKQAMKAIEQAIYLYNHRRPHAALNYRIPAEVHEKVKQAS